MDGDRPAGLRHHGRRLQSGLQESPIPACSRSTFTRYPHPPELWRTPSSIRPFPRVSKDSRSNSGPGRAKIRPSFCVCLIIVLCPLTTWNINSVRLRIDIVAKFLKSARPDVLCLQETKCIDDAFPLKRFKRLGYEHVALNGQRAITASPSSRNCRSRPPISEPSATRSIPATSRSWWAKAQNCEPLVLHNFYVPAGGAIPDPAAQSEIRSQARYFSTR